MYRSIYTELWTDPDIKSLSVQERYVFLYLITSPHSHLSGLYYLPKSVIQLETGLTASGFEPPWKGLLESKKVYYEDKLEQVWVVNMLEYQGKGRNIEKGVASHLRTLHNSSLIPQFLSRYPAILPFYQQPSPKGVRTLIEGESSSTYPDPDTDPVTVPDSDSGKKQNALLEKSEKLAAAPALSKRIRPRSGTDLRKLEVLEAADKWFPPIP